MSTSAIGRPLADRIGKPMRSAEMQGAASSMRLRAKPRNRTIPQIAATAAILLLIMIGGMGLRLLLWLPQGVFH